MVVETSILNPRSTWE